MKAGRALGLLLWGMALLFLAGPAEGQGPIRVLSNTYETRFGESITFRLTAESESIIEKVELFYIVKGQPATSRGVPQFSAGRRVEAEYKWRIEQGRTAPASEIEYYWRLQDSAGNTLQTERVHFIYHDERFQWKSLTQGNITLYWYREDERFARKLLDMASQALARVEEAIGVDLGGPIKIVVYLGKRDMEKALPDKGEVHEALVSTAGTVVSGDTMLLNGSLSGLEEILAHELTHMVVRVATDNPYAEAPAWLNEGLAMYSEGELPSHNTAALVRAIRRDELISVRSLSAHTGRVDQVNLFYAECYSVVKFLIDTYGREKMKELLATFKEGTLQEQALRKVYGFGLDELDARWRESIGAKSRATPVVEPSGEVERKPAPTTKERKGICSSLLSPALGIVGLFLISRLRVNHGLSGR